MSDSAVVVPAPSPCQKLKAALFDIDGTLADTDVFHRQVFRDVFLPFGINCDREFYDKHISGKHNPEIAATLLPQLSVEEGAALMAKKEALYRERAEAHLQPLPGLLSLLDALKARNVRLAAVTNAPGENARMMLRVLKVEHYFEHVILAEDCVRAKPHPEPYLEAMRRFGVQGEECVVFEDSPSGAKAGKAAEAVTVGIRTTQTSSALESAGAHVTVQDFRDLNVDKLINDLENFVQPYNDKDVTPSSSGTDASTNAAQKHSS